MHKEAMELNEIIKKESPLIYGLLSETGKKTYFSKTGIFAQSLQAKQTELNATIGIALEEDGSIMHLKSITKYILLEPQDIFPYVPMPGKPELRKLWQQSIYEKNPSLKSLISTPVVTNALTHGVSVTAQLFIDPEDIILLSDKSWSNYNVIFSTQEPIFKSYKTFSEGGLDIDALEDAFGQNIGKKILLLNYPNNPTGYSPTNKEVQRILEIIKKRADMGDRILAVCDDAYFGLTYEDNVYKESLFAPLSNIHENILAIKIDGATKENFAWGLRVGFLTFGYKGMTKSVCKALEEKIVGTVARNISNVSNLSQSLVLKSLNSPDYSQEKQEILKLRYNAIKEVLKNPKFNEYFNALPFNSGYFMCLELNKNIDIEKVRKKLLLDYDTGVVTTSGCIRIAFSSVNLKNIPLLFENIYTACKNIV